MIINDLFKKAQKSVFLVFFLFAKKKIKTSFQSTMDAKNMLAFSCVSFLHLFGSIGQLGCKLILAEPDKDVWDEQKIKIWWQAWSLLL